MIQKKAEVLPKQSNCVFEIIFGEQIFRDICLVMCISFALGLFLLIASVIKGHGRFRASINLHGTLLLNIPRSPAYFFDGTPTGRIINRFSKDLDTIDLMVPFTMTRFAHMALETLCTVGVIGYSTPLVLVVLVPLALLYYLIQVQYSSPCMHRVVGVLSKIERSEWRKIYWLFHWFFGNNSLNLKKILINQLDFGPFVSFTLHNRNCLHLPLRLRSRGLRMCSQIFRLAFLSI